MKILVNTVLILFLLQLVACDVEEKKREKPPIRGVKTLQIGEIENTITRRYPTQLQSTDISALSFEIGGRLEEKHLEVGQKVSAGQILFTLDPKSLRLAVGKAEAALQQALATASDATSDLQRQQSLYQQKIVSRSKVERAETAQKVANAQVQQARKQVEAAKDNLSKSKLIAPFDGVIGKIGVESFEMVSPGTTVVSLYKPNTFEAQFGVSLEIINRLAVGDPVWVKISKNKRLKGVVSELGADANSVATFPVVVKLIETSPTLKSGAAVEIELTVKINEKVAHPLPLSALIIEGNVKFGEDSQEASMTGEIYLYDPDSETVKRHTVNLVGIRENEILISHGLKKGDRVVVAGVPFLRDGLAVKLLQNSQER
ncbi:MAG: hypothetical protein CSA22_05080 [Deltaproteobacteria bacterium]|nr:MAG: hypothetical protein CSA22_05080 [Deltaproteobacteria bacterium]